MGNENYNNKENIIKVSVILPIYNVGKFLNQCLDSVVNQTLKDIEIICINDGSTDNSLEILKKYADIDSRFIVLSQENQGQGVARNKGVELAKGKYIQFIDSDDWIELNMLELLYNYAEEHNSQVVKFNYSEYNDCTKEFNQHKFDYEIKKYYNYDLNEFPYYNWKLLKKDCLNRLDLHIWANFYLASFIKSNEIKCAPSRHGEDHLFAIGAIVLANKIDYLNKCLYFYRLRTDSSVHIKSDNNFCVFDNINRLKEFLIKNKLFDELQNEWINYAKTITSLHYIQIPDISINKYENMCLEYFSSKRELKKNLKKMHKKRSFLEQIFSLKNEYKDAIKYKVVTIFGFKFFIKPKRKNGEMSERMQT